MASSWKEESKTGRRQYNLLKSIRSQMGTPKHGYGNFFYQNLSKFRIVLGQVFFFLPSIKQASKFRLAHILICTYFNMQLSRPICCSFSLNSSALVEERQPPTAVACAHCFLWPCGTTALDLWWWPLRLWPARWQETSRVRVLPPIRVQQLNLRF